MMQINGGIWLPDGEQDKVMLGAGAQYQGSKLRAALKYVKKARRAIDIGAHCGLWSLQLGQYFSTVECFEPLSLHIECWKKNVGWKLSCHLHEVALGDEEKTVGMLLVNGLSGRSHVLPDEDGGIQMKRLDDYDFTEIDFIKIDVEGFEYYVIKGAEKTIARHRPVMVVEQKPAHGGKYGLSDTQAIDYLKSLGAVVREEIVGDFVLSWDHVDA